MGRKKKSDSNKIEAIFVDEPADLSKEELNYLMNAVKTYLGTPECERNLCRERLWLDKAGISWKYEDLADRHLANILKMMEERRFKNPNKYVHLKSLKQEQKRRTTKAGKILYGE